MGIDYGRHPMENGNLPNRDPKTLVRYGIVPSHRLADWILDELEPVYYYVCECGKEFGNDEPQQIFCPECGVHFSEYYWDNMEPCGWLLKSDGVVAEMDSHGDLWVFESPVKSKGSHCSPCAPGAVYLSGSGEVEAYGLPEEWLSEDGA